MYVVIYKFTSGNEKVLFRLGLLRQSCQRLEWKLKLEVFIISSVKRRSKKVDRVTSLLTVNRAF